jgi:hypothetical protein
VYLAEKIDRRLLTLREKWVGRMLKSTIVKQLQDVLKPFGIIVLWENNSRLKPNSKWIKGFYYWNRRIQPVEIILEFSTESPYYDWDHADAKLQRTLFFLSQTVQHELIHKAQNQRRNPETYTHDLYMPINHRKTGAAKSQIEYLSLFDEIDSYGHDIAMEICYHYPNDDPHEVLKNIRNYKLLKSYRYYVKTFAGTRWSVIHNKLIKKIHGWLPYVTVMEKR